MFQLSVLIAVICVPILAMLAMGARMEQKQRRQADTVQEQASLKALYERQV